MELTTVEILGGSTSLIKGYGYGTNPVTVTKNDGWEDYAGVTLNKAPKLIGAGDYILGERLGSRTLTIVFSVTGSVGSARGYWRALFNFTMTKGAMATIHRTIVDGGSTTVETLTGKIISVKPTMDKNEQTIEVVVDCVNPYKTISINGNTSTTL